MGSFTMFSFIFFTGMVALVSWMITRREKLNTKDGYFLGGRGLGWFLVGGSLFLSNISANSLVGEPEAVYIANTSVMMWGFSSIVAMVLVSEFILPIYLRLGVVSTPDYIGRRFDPSVKQWIGALFVISYMVNLMPPVLYTGAVVFNGMFDLSGTFGISDWAAIWILVWAIGIVGALYAIFGGLKAIAASDALNGVGLVIGGLMVPYFGLRYLGDGNFMAGLDQILTTNKSHLTAIGGPTDPVPFATIFTGMLLVNLNYWGTEQYVLQRALGSRNLAEGQKGFMFGALLKFIAPIITCIPGLIALALLVNVENTAEVYTRLVAEVMPTYLIGFIAAVVFGAALTTFNSGLNSTSTIAILDLYKPYVEKRGNKPDDQSLIKTSKKFQVIVAIISMTIAPFIAFSSEGFYDYFQKVAGFFSVPIFTIVFIGFVTRRVPALGAKVALIFYLLCYGYTQLIYDFGLHFLHIMAILFVTTSAVMLVIGKYAPADKIMQMPEVGSVNLSPWPRRKIYYTIAIIAMIGGIILFSPLGIAG